MLFRSYLGMPRRYHAYPEEFQVLNVMSSAGATILGGETVIGKGSVIGGNVWLTESVPPFSVVYHKSEYRLRSKQAQNAPIDFSI